MANQIYTKLSQVGAQLRSVLAQQSNTNILTDELENDILNLENIIENKILNLRPDSEYKNSNVDKSFIGLGNVTNDKQVKDSNKASILEATNGTDDTKWMTPKKTYEAIQQFDAEQSQSTTQQLEELRHSWLYSSL